MVTKAEVDEVVLSIKRDPTKLRNFCMVITLQNFAKLAEEQKNEQTLREIDLQIGEAPKLLGPQYQKVMISKKDEASAKSLDHLFTSCKA